MARGALVNQLRWWFMPGLDLMTRRRVRLRRYWKTGPRRVLDAGSGNGWFSYLAYRSGATVAAVNNVEYQVRRATEFYNDWLGVPKADLAFHHMNLYELDGWDAAPFDEIICYETLEHIKYDDKVCQSFYRLLKPGGTLHLCCPYAEHPYWKNEWLDPDEKVGYHVRAGYTLESYRRLLEPIGFRVERSEGVGGPLLTNVAHGLARWRGRLGDALMAPACAAALPLVALDSAASACPCSLYVEAVKPAASAAARTS